MPAGKQVKLVGKLKQTPDGFVYLDVPDDVIYGFYKAVSGDNTRKPPYFSKKFNKVGAHISVTNTKELDGKICKEIGDEIEYTLDDFRQVKPVGWDEMKQVYFISVKSPKLESIRKKYGLPAKKHGHEFHITIAVEPVTSESYHRLGSLYEEAPEGIGFRNAKNLGRKLAKALGVKFGNTKAFARDTHNKRRKQLGQAYPSGPRINTSPVPAKPRHRKFFGMDKPQIPY